MSDRLSLATSTGLPLAALALHVGVALIALAAGIAAIAARKGGVWHRRSGMLFVYTMIATGISAAGISIYEGKSTAGGLLTAYFVFTAWTALKRLPAASRRVDITLLVQHPGFTPQWRPTHDIDSDRQGHPVPPAGALPA